jgi:hypothetical protein
MPETRHTSAMNAAIYADFNDTNDTPNPAEVGKSTPSTYLICIRPNDG